MGRLLLFILLFSCSFLKGQYFTVDYSELDDSETATSIKKIEGPYSDTIVLLKKVNAVKTSLYSHGYLFSESTIQFNDSLAILKVNAGPRITQAEPNLKLPDGFAIPELADAPFRSFSATQENLDQLVNYYLSYFENNGHPFASVNFEDYHLENDTLKGNVVISPGPQITLDSVAIKGFDKFSKNVLRYDLGFKKGMPYSEEFITQLPKKTQQIEYLKMIHQPAVAFTKKDNILFLYFEEVKGNQIDGVVGLNTDERGAVTLNGDLQLRLLHVFKKGEEFNLRWRRPDESVQTLNFDVQVPYLFNTPFWLQTDLAIFRQDTSFINTDIQGLLKFLIESGSFISGGVNYRSSNVLQAISSSQALTGYGSFKTTTYKLGMEFNKANRALIPTQGFRLKSYGLRGLRKTSEASQVQYGWQIDYNLWLPLFSTRHILKTRINSEALFGQNLFINELYRIGGLKTLRGFNEQSIYASSYGIATLEYRYMIGEYDYLTLFSDIGYVENRASDNFTSNLFTGLGGGISFQTGGGIFSLFYAIGKDDQNPFDFRTSKIHFGYVNRF